MIEELDIHQFERPPDVPDYVWDDPRDRPDFIKDCPHPSEIIAVPCSGNVRVGNDENHAWQVRRVNWRWIEPGDEKSNFLCGEWIDEHIVLTDWLEENDINRTFPLGVEEVFPKKTTTHGCCPACRNRQA